MAFLALLIGVVLIVSAIRNTHGNLLSALIVDVPGFAIWGAALLAVSLIGFIPGLKPVSRGLLWLVLTVLILRNYKNILASFQGTWQGAEAQAATPAPASSGSSTPFAGAGGGGFGGGGATGSWTDTLTSVLGSDNSGSAAQVNG